MIAIVLMKESSSRVPQKNHRLMCGMPLFYYILMTLQKCKEVDNIIVNTDSEWLGNYVNKFFPEVKVYERPDYMKEEFDSTGRYIFADIFKWQMDQLPKEEHFLHVHTTNPHLKSETIDKAIQAYYLQSPIYDSVFGVTKKYIRLFDKNAKPLLHDARKMERSQDLEPVFEDNSTIYVFSRSSFAYNNNRIGKNPYMFEMSAIEAIDIDWEEDWLIAESVMAWQKLN